MVGSVHDTSLFNVETGDSSVYMTVSALLALVKVKHHWNDFLLSKSDNFDFNDSHSNISTTQPPEPITDSNDLTQLADSIDKSIARGRKYLYLSAKNYNNLETSTLSGSGPT